MQLIKFFIACLSLITLSCYGQDVKTYHIYLGDNYTKTTDLKWQAPGGGLYSKNSIDERHGMTLSIDGKDYKLNSELSLIDRSPETNLITSVSVWPMKEPKKYFEVIDELERLLKGLGVPEKEIKQKLEQFRSKLGNTYYPKFKISGKYEVEVDVRTRDVMNTENANTLWFIILEFSTFNIKPIK